MAAPFRAFADYIFLQALVEEDMAAVSPPIKTRQKRISKKKTDWGVQDTPAKERTQMPSDRSPDSPPSGIKEVDAKKDRLVTIERLRAMATNPYPPRS